MNSTFFSAVGAFGSQFILLLTTALLSRILDPEDFGLVALLLLGNGVLTVLAGAGMSSVIVQFRNFSAEEMRDLSGLCWLVGLCAAIFSYFVSDLWVLFFDEPRLGAIIKWGSLALLFLPLTQIIDGVLVRDARFSVRAFIAISSAFLSGVVGVVLAVNSFGYWALVSQVLLRTGFEFAIGLFFVRSPLTPRIRISSYLKIWKYLSNLLGFRVLYFFTVRFDSIFIGKALGVTDLGIYSRAYSLFNLSVSLLQAVIGPVLHTSFARISGDPQKLRVDALAGISMLASITVPLMGVASIYACEVVHTVWGANWNSAVFPFSCLAIAGALQPLQAVSGGIMKSKGLAGELLLIGLIKFAIYGGCVFAGYPYGIDGVALGVCLASVGDWLLCTNFVFIFRAGVPYRDLLIAYARVLIISVPIFAMAFLGKTFLFEDLSASIRLLAVGALSAVVYCFLCFLFNAPAYSLAKSLSQPIIRTVSKWRRKILA